MMRIILYVLFTLLPVFVTAQHLPDTLVTGTSRFIRFNNHPPNAYTVRIEKDSILTVYTASGIKQDFVIKEFKIAFKMYGIDEYHEVTVRGNCIRPDILLKLEFLKAGSWLAFEDFVFSDQTGKQIESDGEKWVKL